MNVDKLLWFWIAVIGVFAGCSTPPVAETAPLLKLSPASLGRELAMTQQLMVQSFGQRWTFDVALEADAASIRLAVLQFGRTVARLEWDGRFLTRTLTPGWPDGLLAERMLNDLQLAWWPANAVRDALPAGWTLVEMINSRTLLHENRVVVAITLPKAETIVIQHLLEGYTVQVRTEAQNPLFDSIADKP